MTIPCDSPRCNKKAVVRVSDGPHGLSRECNIYYLCEDHKRPAITKFENVRFMK